MFTINFETDKSVFSSYPEVECARILVKIANDLNNGGAYEGSIRDINGNSIGSYELWIDEDED